VTIDRPLKLGELLAETVRLYGERIWPSLGIGVFVAATLWVGLVTDSAVVFVVLFSLAFTAAWAAAARLVSGDRFGEAWARLAPRVPVLIALTLVVSFPFTLGRLDPVLLLFGVFWLGLTGFAIPVAVLEKRPDGGPWYAALTYALGRSVSLARAHYLHAVGIAAALVILYVLVGTLLVQALLGFAENGELASVLLAQVVLAPFFFIGLSVLYFEQRARALSSPRHPE
jgi:hypothetical protein